MTLPELNQLPAVRLKEALFACCGSAAWVEKMYGTFPVPSMEQLLDHATSAWLACSEPDWLEAFSHHPRIGGLKDLEKRFAATAAWASGEQAGVAHSGPEVLEALAAGNTAYEQKFGFIFIVCATSKSAPEMLNLLNSRMGHSRQEELHIAAKEQEKITRLRLQKLLSP